MENTVEYTTVPVKKDYFGVEEKYVGVLDGVRALSILIVLWFHFWQQTWLMPEYKTPFLAFLGIERIDCDSFRRCGYLFVDMMILLSAFVLYLPRVCARYDGRKIETPWNFYKRRIARIVPCYVVTVLVMFIYAICIGQYKGRTSFAFKDIITSLTFTRVIFKDIFSSTCIGHVLWTVCIEVYFYLIFPFLSKFFSKMPYIIYPLMVGAGYAFTYLYILKYKNDNLRMYVNSFIAFLPVFANGMAAAEIYVFYSRKIKQKAIFSFVGMALFFAACWYTTKLMYSCKCASECQVWQLEYKYTLSLTFTVLMLGLAISPKPLRSIFSCKLFKFLAMISYNIYMWHQWIMVLIRQHYGDTGADVAAGGATAQWIATILGLTITVAVATIMTFLIEKPVANLINGKTENNFYVTIGKEFRKIFNKKNLLRLDFLQWFHKEKYYSNKTVKKKR